VEPASIPFGRWKSGAWTSAGMFEESLGALEACSCQLPGRESTAGFFFLGFCVSSA
jgi:hypothetical protein